MRKSEIAHRRGLADSLQRRDEALARADNEWSVRSSAIEGCRDAELTTIESKCRERVDSIESQAKSELDSAENQFARERMAHGGLAQPDAIRGLADALRPQDGVEDDEQVEIDRAQFHDGCGQCKSLPRSAKF